MRQILVLCALCVSCGDDEEPYTWGDVSAELSLEYCEGLERCGWFFSEDDGVNICAEHTAFHLCETDRSCDREVDEKKARVMLDACSAAFDAMDPEGAE